MLQPNQRARIKTFSGSWYELTILMKNPKNENWICLFDDGSVAQYEEKILQPVPVEIPVALTPEVF